MLVELSYAHAFLAGGPWVVKVKAIVLITGQNNGVVNKQRLNRFGECYNVPYVEIKGWRHTYATLGIEQNHLTPKQVQAQLGHSTTNMTLNVYAGITDQEKARTADIMGSIINLDAEF